MSMLVVSTQGKARPASAYQSSNPQAARQLEDDEMTPVVEALPPVLLPMFTGGILWKLACCISAFYVRLFGRSAPDCDAVEQPDSDYTSCWSCCI